MPVYRFQAPAVIMFDVRADNEADAVDRANKLQAELEDGGTLQGELWPKHSAAYFLELACGEFTVLSANDIVNEFYEDET